MASLNEQTFTSSKGQALVSLALVVFCVILFYHSWERFLKSHFSEHIWKFFTIQSNIWANDDNKIDLQMISSADHITSSLIPMLSEPLFNEQNIIPL